LTVSGVGFNILKSRASLTHPDALVGCKLPLQCTVMPMHLTASGVLLIGRIVQVGGSYH